MMQTGTVHDSPTRMQEESFRVLEYDKIRQLLAGMTVTAPGHERAAQLLPLDGRQQVEAALQETAEMMERMAEAGSPPLGGLHDLREPLRFLQAEGTWLQPEVLLQVQSSLEAAAACQRYFSLVVGQGILAESARQLHSCRELAAEIRSSIGPRAEILDSASFLLGELREDIRQLRSRIKKGLERLLNNEALAGVFQEKIITERGGRYVVPVRADHRGRIKGFIHDESASGQTLFLEPASVLEWNNDLQTLLREEKREEERVLQRLAIAVRGQSSALSTNQEILARFDLRAAASRFAQRSTAVVPKLSAKPVIDLRGARHPLLLFQTDGRPRPEPAIPIDLRLPDDRTTLVISGPNTGGKTVALKTTGLLMLMVLSGLPIPCEEESRLYLFGKVFADIGDEQSIEENLSTFSGHLTRIRRILAAADANSLVLLDEVGTGTDPAEGGGLAMALLDLLRQRGARTIVTTHLNLVKSYAFLEDGVENAAVEFDSRTLAPTYRLHYGIPGASSAFTIARRLGLPEELLTRAESYLSGGEKEGLDLLERLNRLRKLQEQDLAEARILKQRAQQDRERRKKLLEEVEEQRQAILEKARRRGEQLVREADRKLKNLFKELRSSGGESATVRQQAELSGTLREVGESFTPLREERPRSGYAPQQVQVGEILRIVTLGVDGEVLRLQGEDVELSVAGKKLRQPLNKLEQYRPPRFAAPGKRTAVRSNVERGGFQPRLLLVGKRVDEALPLLERFIDDALLHGLREVEVVHGAGEGILRKVVREYLGGHRGVVSFHAGDIAHGGDNVTVVGLSL